LLKPTISIVSALFITSVLPLVILLIFTGLSLKYAAKRKSIGSVAALVGILEILGFFTLSLTIEEVTYRTPFSPRIIRVMQGTITLIGGLVILLYTKSKKIITQKHRNVRQKEA
jgi:hypothetical protein